MSVSNLISVLRTFDRLLIRVVGYESMRLQVNKTYSLPNQRVKHQSGTAEIRRRQAHRDFYSI